MDLSSKRYGIYRVMIKICGILPDAAELIANFVGFSCSILSGLNTVTQTICFGLIHKQLK